MASHGTVDPALLALTPHHQPASLKRARSESPDRTSPNQRDSSRHARGDSDDRHTYALVRDQGRRQSSEPLRRHQSHTQVPTQPQMPSGSLPSWDPRSLLNPKATTSSAGPDSKPNIPRPTVNGHSTTSQVFQFTSPDDNLNQLPNLPNGLQPASGTNGVGAMIERINNVESRGTLPDPKRRKLDDSLPGEPGGHAAVGRGSSSGLLAASLNEKQTGEPNPRVAATLEQTVDLTDSKDESEVQVIEDPSLQEVCFGMLDVAQVNCHTVPAPRPGSVNLGGDTFWPAVKTVLKRKVGDVTFTVQVYDHTREVFGNLDVKTSHALVPLLDSPALQLRTECRIPSRKKLEDEIPGSPISRSYKMEIVLYGRMRYVRQVGKLLKDRGGIQLLSPHLVNRGIQVVNPHALEPLPGSPATRPLPGHPVYAYSAPPTARTVEEVRADVMGVFDTLNQSGELPEMEADPIVQTELLPHQKQGLFFMTARENPDENCALQKKHMRSMWKKERLHGGNSFFNLVTGHSMTQKPPDTLGGILADMMGLGKTLSILSLIASSREKAAKWAAKEPQQPSVPDRRRASVSRFNAPVPEPLGLTKLSRNAKTTLLVCPLSTITNWEEQLKTHISPGGLSYHIYHGQNRIKEAAQLATYDLVITTYGSVSSELTSRSKRKAQALLPLEEIGWFRIVLDEAHMIREQSTLQFKAICRLQACRRWAVTGTPVQNRLDDLAALLAFLRLSPFEDRNKFNTFIIAPFKSADPEIVPKLRILVDTITLRRLKDKIHLPPREDKIVRLPFSPEEQQLYDLFARNAQERMQVLTGNKDRILGGKTYIHILQSILRMRLVCAHGRELLSDEDLKAVQGMTQDSAIDLDSDDEGESNRPALPEEKAYAMFDLMKETNSDTCVMCQRKLGSNDAADIESEREEDILGYMTPCFHLYCPRVQCVRQFRDEDRGIAHNSGLVGDCPICKTSVKFSCAELRHMRADVEHEAASGRNGGKLSKSSSSSSFRASGPGKNAENYGGPHSKTRALVEDLQATQAESELLMDEPPIKSVVFSGWTSHLDLIQLALDQNDIKYTRLDGKMTRTARTQAMDTFRDDPDVHVILVSIMAGGLGLNLTAGSRVYVMEPQYNPAAEAQAIDRVHRLGQKRPVRTVRYIMTDSFEEKMLALQDKKNKLASLSMDRHDKTMDKREAARQRLLDLKTLFK